MSELDTPNQNQPSSPTTPHHHKWLLIPILIVVIALLGVGIYYMNHPTTTKSPSTQETSENGPSMYITPAQQDISKGETLTLSVWVDSGEQPINAVQANLEYPADKFDFKSIDSVGSSFEIQAQATGGEGKVTIVRGQAGNLAGKHLVAKVNLVAKADSGQAAVTISNDSVIARSTDSVNIIKKIAGGNYTIKAAQ